MLNFETRELTEKVRMMPQRSASDWVALGVKNEEQNASEAGPRLAAEAYRSALDTDHDNVDALNNLGTLSYEEGNLEDAIAVIEQAAGECQLQPHFGDVLSDEDYREAMKQRFEAGLPPRQLEAMLRAV
jgi:tetratricopeptide (TPR) repeat protein